MGIQIAVRDKIMALCSIKKISFNKLANISGIPSSTVKNILNGKSNNTGIVTIKKLCDGLEISIQDFFDDDIFKNLEQEIK